jgi:addiction module RelB/DinJ family antitoxin
LKPFFRAIFIEKILYRCGTAKKILLINFWDLYIFSQLLTFADVLCIILLEVIGMANTRSSGMHIRINPEIKAEVEPILNAIGLSFSDVFNLTLRQIYLKRKIPFELSSLQLTDNGYTSDFEAELIQVSEESYTAVAKGAKTYKNAAELRAALDAEEEND